MGLGGGRRMEIFFIFKILCNDKCLDSIHTRAVEAVFTREFMIIVSVAAVKFSHFPPHSGKEHSLTELVWRKYSVTWALRLLNCIVT